MAGAGAGVLHRAFLWSVGCASDGSEARTRGTALRSVAIVRALDCDAVSGQDMGISGAGAGGGVAVAEQISWTAGG